MTSGFERVCTIAIAIEHMCFVYMYVVFIPCRLYSVLLQYSTVRCSGGVYYHRLCGFIRDYFDKKTGSESKQNEWRTSTKGVEHACFVFIADKTSKFQAEVQIIRDLYEFILLLDTSRRQKKKHQDNEWVELDPI